MSFGSLDRRVSSYFGLRMPATTTQTQQTLQRWRCARLSASEYADSGIDYLWYLIGRCFGFARSYVRMFG